MNVMIHAVNCPTIIPYHAPCSPIASTIANMYENIKENINCLINVCIIAVIPLPNP